MRSGQEGVHLLARGLDLDAGWLGILLLHKQRQDAARPLWGSADPDHDLVFAQENRTPIRPDTASRALTDDGQLDQDNTSSPLLNGSSTEPVQAILAEATATIAHMQRDAERAEQAHETWKDLLTEDPHRRATEQNLCSQFDDFCQQHGLRRRAQDYDVSITAGGQPDAVASVAPRRSFAR